MVAKVPNNLSDQLYLSVAASCMGSVPSTHLHLAVAEFDILLFQTSVILSMQETHTALLPASADHVVESSATEMYAY